MIELRQSTAGQEVPLGYFLDSTDGDTEETGLTISNTDIKIWKWGATSLANKNSGGATHMANGIYYAVLDATDTDTLGPLVIYVHESGALTVRLECAVLPANVWDSRYSTDKLEVDVQQWDGSNVPTPTNAGVPETDPVYLDGDATSMDDLKDFADDGYDPITDKVQGVVLVDTTTTNTDMVSEPPTAAEVQSSCDAAITANTDINNIDTGVNNIEAKLPTNYLMGSSVQTDKDDEIDAIKAVTDNLPNSGALSDIDTGVNNLETRVPDTISLANINAEVDTSIETYKLDHLVAAADADDPVNDSIIAKLASSDGDWSGFDNTAESLEAMRDRGDAAWTTGAGTGLTALATGTAQAGAAGTITLAAGASATDNLFNGTRIIIHTGTGAGQGRIVTDYNGTTKVATIVPNWVTNPDATSQYEIQAADSSLGTIQNDGQSVTDLKDFADVGYDPSSNKVQGVVLVDTTTTNTDMVGTDNAAPAATALTNATWTDARAGYLDNVNNADLQTTVAQTGDNFVRIGANGAGLTNINLPNQTMDITGNLSGSVGSVIANVTVGDIVAAALVKFFATDSGTTYGASVSGSVVKEIADNAGGGSSVNLQVFPNIPATIDLADTKSWRVGLIVLDVSDDLPSTGEITPGTIDIDRSADGGTTWSSVVSTACSEQAGMIYYEEVFDSGTGYADGDSIRFTFKSQSVVIGGNTYEISDANGLMFYSTIGGGGGTATAANQTTIINHLTDVKGTGFVPDTDSLVDLLHKADDIDGETVLTALKAILNAPYGNKERDGDTITIYEQDGVTVEAEIQVSGNTATVTMT